MSRPKSLIKEEVPTNVAGEIANYLKKHCGIPGCSPVVHLEEAHDIIRIIVEYNKNKKEGN